MILSRVALDTYKRDVIKALNNPKFFHGAIENSFQGERKRNLWRIDRLNNQMYILILSDTEPNLTSFHKQFGIEELQCEYKSYDRLLENIKNGDKFHFRLTANPTKSLKNSYSERGKIVAYYEKEQINGNSERTVCKPKEWLIDKSIKNGFKVNEQSFDTVEDKWYKFHKKNERNCVSLFSVTYEGFLEVTDADLFRNALVNGIGRGKAYGMGMITVIKMR